MIEPFATNAYQTAQKLGQKAAGAADSQAADTQDKFKEMVSAAVGSIAENGAASETSAIRHLAGEASVVDVVTAVAETEIAFETLVSVRDRVIAAYQEIMRMPI